MIQEEVLLGDFSVRKRKSSARSQWHHVVTSCLRRYQVCPDASDRHDDDAIAGGAIRIGGSVELSLNNAPPLVHIRTQAVSKTPRASRDRLARDLPECLWVQAILYRTPGAGLRMLSAATAVRIPLPANSTQHESFQGLLPDPTMQTDPGGTLRHLAAAHRHDRYSRIRSTPWCDRRPGKPYRHSWSATRPSVNWVPTGSFPRRTRARRRKKR